MAIFPVAIKDNLQIWQRNLDNNRVSGILIWQESVSEGIKFMAQFALRIKRGDPFNERRSL
jgi:hypothetical protein